MKLKDYNNPAMAAEFKEKNYALPLYDREALVKRTKEAPAWVHFGAGNIFRAYQSELLEKLLNEGLWDRGVIVAEAYDYDIIDRAYAPYDNLTLSVVLHGDGRVDKRILGCIAESLKADTAFPSDWQRLQEIFRAESLQMVTFSVTENGYGFTEEDLQRGLASRLTMGKLTALLYERFLAGAAPLTLQSQDNCSHNGDHVKAAVFAYAEAWEKLGITPPEFTEYVENPAKASYPLSMIDKITPRPDERVKELLEREGFEDNAWFETARHSFSAPFVNAEEAGYLVMEDSYVNGRLPLEKAGAVFTDRETVEKVERMKVGTCLNPLHTALATFGCMMGFTLVSEEMKDADVLRYLERLGNEEGLPVCVDPGILNPKAFMDECLYVRFPNPYMPDTPQRIAVDNSATIPIRFGGTLQEYIRRGAELQKLTFIPLMYAAYARYLKGIDDFGNTFTPSPDDRLGELMPIVGPLQVGDVDQDFDVLKELFTKADIFGADLVECGLYEKVIGMCKELFAGPGAIRKTLHQYVTE